MDSSRLRSVITNLHSLQYEHPPLTADEEMALCEEYANDRDGLCDELVLHNIGFAIAFVRKYNERGEDREDMWMRGLLGLSEAAREFDPSRGVRFCTFSVPYIQKAMRDLFDPLLVAPRTQLATQAAYDAPIRRDDGSGDIATAGDFLALNASAPGWDPVRPDLEPKRRYAKSGVAELVEYLAGRFGGSARDRDIIKARLLGWTCEDIGRRLLGVSRQAAHQRCEKVMFDMCRAIRNIRKGDELYGVFNRAGTTVPSFCSPTQLHCFVVAHYLEIVDDVEFETLEDRRGRMLEEYDAAEAEHRLATGRRDDGGADYALMRAVYADAVAGTLRLNAVAERRGIPHAYAWFLRDKAVKMVKDSKNGTLRRLVEKHRIHGIDPEGHHIKDELFNTVLYPEPSDPEGAGSANYITKYDRIVEQMTANRDRAARRERNLRRRLLATWKNYGGGFYSEENHLRMSGRTKNGKTRLTKREIRALAQFCDDISPA